MQGQVVFGPELQIAKGLVDECLNEWAEGARDEIRAIEELARIATIEDPALLHSVQRFYSECFKPAQSRYINTVRTDISASGQAILAITNTNYGPNDVGWMGSQLFRTEPGFDLAPVFPDPPYSQRNADPLTGEWRACAA